MTPLYLDTRNAAKFLGLTERGLANYRHRGLGPAYFRVGGRRTVRYKVVDLIAWAESERVESRALFLEAERLAEVSR